MTRSSLTSGKSNPRSTPLPQTLLSKFTSTFTSRQRNPLEPEIRLDEQFKTFCAGEAVRGAVILNAAKPVRITHLVIRLHGFVKVVNNVRLPGETIPYDENLLTSMRNRKGIEYFGNGFARLFEDEFTLCGDGRLFGKYEFRFELNLPPEGIPSSIDFEHGTISYLLSATLTKPTTMSPTLTSHHKLKVLGNVDIARIPLPKFRTVSMEAVSKRTKPKLRVMRKTTGVPNGRDSLLSGVDETSSNRDSAASPLAVEAPPQSPVPSTMSSISAEGSSLSASNTVVRPLPNNSLNGSADNLEAYGASERTITARTELLQGGCLPGDTLHIRISIDHIKSVQTMQGIIITIYRQGRIDTHPAIPLGPMNSGDRRQYEDYYPRSRTGLGGLSLSSAGSSRAFRQDIAQSITPLFVDPHTLSTSIKASIQMPDHAFPTITSVPGDMISFRYYVEVVMDLRGKLAGQDRFLPNFNIVDGPQHAYGDPKISKVQNVEGVSYSTTPGFNYLITDQIRRARGVVCSTIEVIVGTKDTTRSRGKQREGREGSNQDGASYRSSEEEYIPYEGFGNLDVQHIGSLEQRTIRATPDYEAKFNGNGDIPAPDLEEPLDEKAQIRRAEERLLPSAPPQDDDAPYVPGPSAPFAYDEEDFVNRYGFGAPAPAYDGPSAPPAHEVTAIQDFAVPVLQNGVGMIQQPHSDPADNQLNVGSQTLETAASSPGTIVGGRTPTMPTHPIETLDLTSSCKRKEVDDVSRHPEGDKTNDEEVVPSAATTAAPAAPENLPNSDQDDTTGRQNQEIAASDRSKETKDVSQSFDSPAKEEEQAPDANSDPSDQSQHSKKDPNDKG